MTTQKFLIVSLFSLSLVLLTGCGEESAEAPAPATDATPAAPAPAADATPAAPAPAADATPAK